MRECGAQIQCYCHCVVESVLLFICAHVSVCLYVYPCLFVSMCLLSWQKPAVPSSYLNGYRHVILHKSPWNSICYASHMGVYLYIQVFQAAIFFRTWEAVKGDVSHCYSFTPPSYCVTSLSELIIMYCEVACYENKLKKISLAVL